MKKLVAIAASAVLAVSAIAFAACSNNNGDEAAKLPQAPSGKYEEVDTTDAEKKEELVETATEKFDLTKMFGDMSAQGWSFGLASDRTVKFEASGKMLGVLSASGQTEDVNFNANVALTDAMKVKAVASGTADSTVPVNLSAAEEMKIKGSADLPDMVYLMLGKQGDTIKELVKSFDYTVSEYLDSGKVYYNVPSDVVEKLPEDVKLPEDGKFMMDNTGMLSHLEIPLFGNLQINVGQYVEMVIGMMNAFDVSVSVSTDNGYTVKLNAGLESAYKFAADRLGMPEAALEGLVGGYVKDISTCKIEAYLSVDEDGLFRGLGVSLNVAASTELAAGKIALGSPAINASAKLQIGFSVSKFDGNIQLPSDLDSYVDIKEFNSSLGSGNSKEND